MVDIVIYLCYEMVYSNNKNDNDDDNNINSNNNNINMQLLIMGIRDINIFLYITNFVRK